MNQRRDADYNDLRNNGHSHEQANLVLVERLYDENARLRDALRAAGLSPAVVDSIAAGEPPRPCPAGHGSQCCGYPSACEDTLAGRQS